MQWPGDPNDGDAIGIMGSMTDISAAPTVNLAQAVELTGKSKSTIRRRKAELLEHGARADAEGWVIPVPALIAVGLMDNVTPPDTGDTGMGTAIPNGVSQGDEHRIADLERELAVYKERAAQQEKRIADLQAQLEDNRTAMHLIEAAKPAESGQHRGLFARLFNR